MRPFGARHPCCVGCFLCWETAERQWAGEIMQESQLCQLVHALRRCFSRQAVRYSGAADACRTLHMQARYPMGAFYFCDGLPMHALVTNLKHGQAMQTSGLTILHRRPIATRVRAQGPAAPGAYGPSCDVKIRSIKSCFLPPSTSSRVRHTSFRSLSVMALRASSE